MTAPQPRRTRRRATPGPSLPRPGSVSAVEAGSGGQRRSISHHREHHVTTDYGYVRRDLIAVSVTSAIAVAFVVGMSFLF